MQAQKASRAVKGVQLLGGPAGFRTRTRQSPRVTALSDFMALPPGVTVLVLLPFKNKFQKKWILNLSVQEEKNWKSKLFYFVFKLTCFWTNTLTLEN